MQYTPIAVFYPSTMRAGATASVIGLCACAVVFAVAWGHHPRNAAFAVLTVVSVAAAIGCAIALARVATRLEIDAQGRLRVHFPLRHVDHDLRAAAVRVDRDIVTNWNKYRSWDAPRTTLTVDLGDRKLMVLAIEEEATHLAGFGATVSRLLGPEQALHEQLPIGEFEDVHVLAGGGYRVPEGARVLGPLVLVYWGGAAAGLALLMLAGGILWVGFDGPLREPVESGRSHAAAIATAAPSGTTILPTTELSRTQEGCPFEAKTVRWLWGAESDTAFTVTHTVTVPYAERDERAMVARLNDAGSERYPSRSLDSWYRFTQWRMTVEPDDGTAPGAPTPGTRTLVATVTTPCVRSSDLARFGDDYDRSLRRLVNWLAHG